LRVPAADDAAATQYLHDAGIDRYIVLSPGGGWRSKCWPPERFGTLCGRIHSALGLRCIVNYGPGEKELAAAVRAASGEADPILYGGELGPLMGVLSRALCVVGGDTGPLHLAVALGTPAVALFGPTDPARNGPYRHVNLRTRASAEDIVLRTPGVTTTHQRGDQPHPSMLAIEVDEVFEAVRHRIGDAK
jgi:heptosyltransferase-1